MTCNDIMKKVVVYLSPEDTARVAAKLMSDADVGFLPVCDNTGKVIGALTDRDIVLRLVASDKPNSTRVAEIMSQEVISCSPDDDIRDAADEMARNQKSRLLVVDDAGKLQGVISLSDLPQFEPEAATRTLGQISEREAHPHSPAEFQRH